MEQPVWRVFRHSGRTNGEWVERYQGEERTARSHYEKLHTDMRQGGVRLVDPSGAVVKDAWAPRVRSRW